MLQATSKFTYKPYRPKRKTKYRRVDGRIKQYSAGHSICVRNIKIVLLFSTKVIISIFYFDSGLMQGDPYCPKTFPNSLNVKFR